MGDAREERITPPPGHQSLRVPPKNSLERDFELQFITYCALDPGCACCRKSGPCRFHPECASVRTCSLLVKEYWRTRGSYTSVTELPMERKSHTDIELDNVP
jgi:hypothetical protein